MTGRIGVLISGSGTNLQALIDAFAHDDTVEVAVVISNKADAYGLERASTAGIPTVVIDHRGKSRRSFDAELVDALRSHRVSWVALAGFMRIITPVFLDAFPGRVINIHPSLLPAFPGVNAQQQAYDAGVAVTGATVHFVDAGMDTGPVIAQGEVALKPKLTKRADRNAFNTLTAFKVDDSTIKQFTFKQRYNRNIKHGRNTSTLVSP